MNFPRQYTQSPPRLPIRMRFVMDHLQNSPSRRSCKMTTMHSYTVSLRIESATLDTARLTRELGMNPTQTRFVGQRRGPNSTWDKALWEFELAPEKSDVAPENWPDWPQWHSLEKAFEKLLRLFSPHTTILQSYRQEHDVYLFVGHFSSSFDGGPRLSAEILKALGDFGVQVYINTFFIDKKKSASP